MKTCMLENNIMAAFASRKRISGYIECIIL
jgi:hypothetical protein